MHTQAIRCVFLNRARGSSSVTSRPSISFEHYRQVQKYFDAEVHPRRSTGQRPDRFVDDYVKTERKFAAWSLLYAQEESNFAV